MFETFGAISTTSSGASSTNYIDGKKVDATNFPLTDTADGAVGNCYYINDNFIF